MLVNQVITGLSQGETLDSGKTIAPKPLENLPQDKLGGSLVSKPAVVLNVNRAGTLAATTMTVSRFLSSLSRITGQVDIADSAGNIAKNLNALNASVAKIGSITQAGTPQNLAITYDQWTTDAAVSGNSVLDLLPDGRDHVVVSAVPDGNRSAVLTDTRVQTVGITGVTLSYLSNRISDAQVSSIGVVGLGTSDLTTSSASLANAKVTSIGVLDVPSASLNTVLSNTKVKTVTVTGVAAKDVATVAQKAQVINFTISDSPVKLAANFGALVAKYSKIRSIAYNVDAPTITTSTPGDETHTEVASVAFEDLPAGQTLTIAGLTFTAGSSGASAAQVANAFSSVTGGATFSALNTSKTLGATRGGTFTSGAASGWTSTTVSGDGNTTVVFTSTNTNQSVNDLTSAISMNLTGAQYKVGGEVLAKFTDSAYTVNLKNVLATDVGTFDNDIHVLSMEVSDTTLSLSRNFDLLNNNLTKITTIGQNGAKNPLTITKTQLDAGTNVFTKISGTYSLAVSDVAYSDLSSLASNTLVKTIGLSAVTVSQLNTAWTNAKVTSISVADTATNINAGLTTLKSCYNKVTQITDSSPGVSTRHEIVFTPANYDAKLIDKISGFSTVVDYSSAAASRYSISTDKQGIRTVTDTVTNVKKVYANNVNFFKFSDKNLFGTTGNRNIDAILMGGTKDWWYDTTRAATSATQISGSMNALDSQASKHTLTYSFLNSVSIPTAKNSDTDSTGFAEMSTAQKSAVKTALDYISSLTNLTFSEAGSSGAGDLNFGTNDQGTASAAYAYNPNTANNINVMLNNHTGAIASTNATFTQGSYGWETLIHEIAHALGLKHPGNYNAGGGGTVGPYLPSGDAGSRRFTIMSYNNPADAQNVSSTTNGNTTTYTASSLNPDTFMVYDIAALQFLYGVNTSASGAQNLRQGTQSESASVLFKPMAAGQTLTIAGLTFTAGASGATAAQVANAFSGISDLIASGELNTLHALGASRGGTFTFGSASGWTSGSVSGSAVVFTSTTTAGTNIENLTSTNTTAPVITTTDGDGSHNETALTLFRDLAAGQTLTVAGLTFTAGGSGANAIQVANAFSGLSNNTAYGSLSAITNGTNGGTFTVGTFAGWSTGSNGGTATVLFTSASANSNVSNLTTTGAAPVITATDGGTASATDASDFQTTTFTSGWLGFQSLYVPEAETGEILDISAISNKNIVDLREGAFSSINVLPPNTKTDLPTTMLRSAQTYFGYNNVALAYGSEINYVKGGTGSDTYYVSDYDISILDTSATNKVYLNGVAADWTASTSNGVTTYVNGQTSQRVELVGAGFSVAYYDAAAEDLTHRSLDLLA